MIYGIGTDLVEVVRIERTLERFGAKFPQRLLMPEELERFERAKNKVRFLGMRFAAKEAIVKAMGTGFRYGVWVRDVGTVPDSKGKPLVIYSPRGQALRERLGIGEGHVSLTDEAGLIAAFAVLLRA